MKLTEKTRANILHFLYLNCTDIAAHPHTTGAGGFYRRYAYSVCVDYCEVVRFGLGEGAEDFGFFKTVF